MDDMEELILKDEFIKLLAEQTAANNSLMDTILGVTE